MQATKESLKRIVKSSMKDGAELALDALISAFDSNINRGDTKITTSEARRMIIIFKGKYMESFK